MLSKLKILFGIAIIFCISRSSTFGEQRYSLTLQNGIQVDSYTYEFDIYINSNDGEFELTSYQTSLTFNSTSINNGQMSFHYIEGTSQLNNIPLLGIGVNKNADHLVLTFASFPGSDIITEREKKVGRFAVKNTVSFLGRNLNISWNFEGRLTTIITGANYFDITNPEFFYSYISNTTDNQDIEQTLNFSLEQNYPNPFNPYTKIKFSIPQNSYIELRIYNSLGEEVANLFNEYCYSGTYEIEFGNNSLPSGLYVYCLLSGKKLIYSRKMLLLK